VPVRRKLKTLQQLKPIVAELRTAGKRIVWTNGCFDLLHVGHVRYLLAAKKLGDVLVVGVNSDESVRKVKGLQRPLVPEGRRAEVVCALECVDYVVIFSERLPTRAIRSLRPDVHAKGGDYGRDQLPEAKVVESYGGRVALLRETKSASTTELVEKIVRLYGSRGGMR